MNYYNLPEPRVLQKRGGGAEAENNRMLFTISGWGNFENVPVEKVKIEQTVDAIIPRGSNMRSLRAKTADPRKIAVYLADYLNQIAEMFPPNLTHE